MHMVYFQVTQWNILILNDIIVQQTTVYKKTISSSNNSIVGWGCTNHCYTCNTVKFQVQQVQLELVDKLDPSWCQHQSNNATYSWGQRSTACRMKVPTSLRNTSSLLLAITSQWLSRCTGIKHNLGKQGDNQQWLCYPFRIGHSCGVTKYHSMMVSGGDGIWYISYKPALPPHQ